MKKFAVGDIFESDLCVDLYLIQSPINVVNDDAHFILLQIGDWPPLDTDQVDCSTLNRHKATVVSVQWRATRARQFSLTKFP